MHDTLSPEAETATTFGWFDRKTDVMAASQRRSTSLLRDPENDCCFQDSRQCMLERIDNMKAYITQC